VKIKRSNTPVTSSATNLRDALIREDLACGYQAMRLLGVISQDAAMARIRTLEDLHARVIHLGHAIVRVPDRQLDRLLKELDTIAKTVRSI